MKSIHPTSTPTANTKLKRHFKNHNIATPEIISLSNDSPGRLQIQPMLSQIPPSPCHMQITPTDFQATSPILRRHFLRAVVELLLYFLLFAVAVADVDGCIAIDLWVEREYGRGSLM